MRDLFVSYELAVKLKEKGFDEPCFGYYADGNWSVFADTTTCNTNSEFGFYPTSPLYQQVIDWFREKHEIEIHAVKQIEEDEYGGIVGWVGVEDYSSKSCKPTYYEALNEAIKKALKLIK